MDFLASKPGAEYKGFVLISVDDIPDFKSKGVYLRHKTTGLEVYHLVNEDEENMFSFCFRTLAKDSKGTAHIIEHSTLCGSEKFPLKEPFSTLANQSLNTFLNAMTYPEKTLYPAASLVSSDYYNLMDVYADAVFFPKLSKKAFAQEGWRLELDENNKASIQGVVYNEMKAAYSTFSEVSVDEFMAAIYPDSIKSCDSGGDPLEIPALSYEQFIAFHKKYYKPSNCILVLYGNLPTTEQLDFLSEKYISRLESAFGTCEIKDTLSALPYVPLEMKDMLKMPRLKETLELNVIAPANGATGNMAALGWYCGPKNIEQYYLSEVLCGSDSSPMSKIFNETKLGDDEAPVNGHFGYFTEETIFAFGLSGVKKGNEKKVFKLVKDSLNEIYEKGISTEDIDSAIMGIDFTLREENRYWSPRSVSLASAVAAAWALGKAPSYNLSPITEFENFKKLLSQNPDLTKQLLKKYLIDQEPVLKFISEPSKKYFVERQKKEARLLSELEKNTDKAALKKELDELHEYQQKVETEEEISCIPHLKLSQLNVNVNYIKTEYKTVNGAGGCKVPLIVSKENTNGIIYLEVCFPIDNLAPSDYFDIPLFNASLTNLGWNGKSWDECTREMGTILGDINIRTLLGTVPDAEETRNNIASYPDKNVAGRFWLNISSKFLSSKLEEALSLIAKLLTTMSFSDKKHFESIFLEFISEKKQNFAGAGNHYIHKRGYSKASVTQAVTEIMWGVTQYIYDSKLSKKSIPSLLKHFEQMYKSIYSQGAVIHVTTDEASLKMLEPELESFAVNANLSELKPPVNHTLKEFDELIYRGTDYKNELNREVIKVPTQSGFAACFFPCSSWLSKEAVAEEVLSNYLSGHTLWEKIRMTGGAYGAYGGNDPIEKLFCVSSYRDPKPVQSFDVFLEALKELSEKDFTEEEIERCILTSYSSYITPDSACNRGSRGFSRYLYGNSWQIMKKTVEMLLKVTPEEVHKAAVRLYGNALKHRSEFLFCDKSVESYGNILKIPL